VLFVGLEGCLSQLAGARQFRHPEVLAGGFAVEHFAGWRARWGGPRGVHRLFYCHMAPVLLAVVLCWHSQAAEVRFMMMII